MKYWPNLFNGSYYNYLSSYIDSTSSVLDIGCGPNSQLRVFSPVKLVGIDGWDGAIKSATEKKTHDLIIQGDVMDIDKLVGDERFDVVVALDLIEHLPKKEGQEFIRKCEKIARKYVIFFTPNGHMDQEEKDGNPLQIHRSSWVPQDFKERSYNVKGFLGWKKLRGKEHKLRYNPKVFWYFISFASHLLFSKNSPNSASAFFAVKTMSE